MLLIGGGDTTYYGIAWCAGTMDIDQGGAITCDGHGMYDDATQIRLPAEAVAERIARLS